MMLEESQSLKLLADVQAELRDTVNALGGRNTDGGLETYRFYTAAYINRGVEGYLYLRTKGMIDASQQLIRPAIEAMIRLKAIEMKPELLFRIAFTEFNEDKKWVRCLPSAQSANALKTLNDQWEEFSKKYRTKYPSHQVIQKELSVGDAAECAKIKGYYDSHYRFYCRFTHAAFRASTKNLGAFEGEDNRTITLCALAGLEALVSIGARPPNYSSLSKRFLAMSPAK